ncbi:MAG: cache domain-containing protein, partial [Vicinamibacteria bacterium]
MFSTVRARLYSLVAIALLPAVAVITYDELQLRRRIFDKIREDAVRVVTLAGQQLETLIGETRTRFELLDDIPEIRAMDAETSRRLAEVLKSEPIYTNLGVADPSGRVVSSAIPFEGEVRVDDRPFFKRAVETRDFSVGTYQVNPISGEPGLNLGYPLLESDGTLRGVLFASLGLEWADQFVRRAQLPEGASLLVLDADGTILARSFEPEGWVGKNVAETELAQRMLRAESADAVVTAGVDGVERLHAYTPIRSGGLTTNAYAALGIPTAVAAAEANRSLLRNRFILSLGAIASFALAGFMVELLFLRETRSV